MLVHERARSRRAARIRFGPSNVLRVWGFGGVMPGVGTNSPVVATAREEEGRDIGV
jgi:hypothetical protein